MRAVLRKALILAEVALAVVLFFALRAVLGDTSFSAWQTARFGAPILSSCLLFFVLPLTLGAVTGRVPGAPGLGLRTADLRAQGRLALDALAFVLPATALFPVIAVVGSDPRGWLGGSILALGFALAAVGTVGRTRHRASIPELPLSYAGLARTVGLLVVGAVVCAVVLPWAAIVARIVTALVFVGLLEEFYFRGYLQGRLNDAFGRPYLLMGVAFGPGLVLAAVAFGLFHPLTVAGSNPWAWALWTGVGGLLFGYLREKSGSFVAPALVHAAMLVPGVLFGAVGN